MKNIYFTASTILLEFIAFLYDKPGAWWSTIQMYLKNIRKITIWLWGGAVESHPHRNTFQNSEYLKAHSHCAIFSDCDCDSSGCNKWIEQDSMEVFSLCDCDNLTNFYPAHYKQKEIAVAIRKKWTVWMSLQTKAVQRITSHTKGWSLTYWFYFVYKSSVNIEYSTQHPYHRVQDHDVLLCSEGHCGIRTNYG